jgi:hypothetical protein
LTVSYPDIITRVPSMCASYLGLTQETLSHSNKLFFVNKFRKNFLDLDQYNFLFYVRDSRSCLIVVLPYQNQKNAKRKTIAIGASDKRNFAVLNELAGRYKCYYLTIMK